MGAAEEERETWRQNAAAASQQLMEGQSKAVGAFLHKFPAAQALLVFFKHILSREFGSPEAAICGRIPLHGPDITRHELEQFLVDDIALRGPDMAIISQALFCVLDLERAGNIPQDLMLHRLSQLPSMKEVWLADLENLWPGREPIVTT